MRELDQEVGLGGQRVKRIAIVRKMRPDAAVFHDSSAQRKRYEDMLAQLGRAVEGMAAEHTEELARAVLALDEAAAAALGRCSPGRTFRPRSQRLARPPRPAPSPFRHAAARRLRARPGRRRASRRRRGAAQNPHSTPNSGEMRSDSPSPLM